MSKQDKFKKMQGQREEIPADEMARATYQRNDGLESLFSNYEGGSIDSSKDLLVRQDDGAYEFGRFRLTPTGLQAPDNVTVSEYADVGRLLLDVGSRIQWLIGDFIVYGEQWQYGETYNQLAEEFGYENKTLREYAYVCRKVDLSIRMDNLTFGHHQAVASLSHENQLHWLTLASSGSDGERWSIKRLKNEIKAAGRQQSQVSQIPAWQKPISVIHEQYVDRWENFKPDQRRLIYESLKSALEHMELMGIDG